jgi:hypothetical protein
MDEAFFKKYRRWLREHPNKFSDRIPGCTGFDLPKTVAERTAKEHRHRQFLNTPPKSDKVQ